PQTVIDVASSVNATSFGTPYAGEIFRESIKNSIVVTTAVTGRQLKRNLDSLNGGKPQLSKTWDSFKQMLADYREMKKEGGKTYLDFRYCNGYAHDTVAWSTLLKHLVMNFDKFSFVEICAYVGPMALFKIIKANKSGETISRRLALPDKKQDVKILDLLNSTDSFCSVNKLRYFSVFTDEYFETLNYELSIDAKALSLQNVMTFVRRRAGGVSLISRELLALRHLRSRDFHSFALTVYLQAKLVNEHSLSVDNNFGPGCGKSYIIRKLATKFDLVYAPFTKLMPDYKNLKDDFVESYDLHFATIHRGLESTCCSTIFIEFTSLPFEYIKMVIAVNKADVFIVGTLNKVKNPQDTVMLLNKNFDYEMEATSQVEKSIYILGPKDKDKMPDHLKDKKLRHTCMSDNLTVVALSRHTETLVIKHDGSMVALGWLNKYKILEPVDDQHKKIHEQKHVNNVISRIFEIKTNE
ncbi:8153_t:CDS:2, partial [Racocetra persica]